MEEATGVGPLATAGIRDGLQAQVQKSVDAGAKVLLAGGKREGPGFWFDPVVLLDPPRDSPAYREELFGPVATVFRVKGVEEALALANDSVYGLGASVWTRDDAERERFIEGLESGMVFVNALVASEPRLPFGGMKNSGYGRELSHEGIREFVNAKTVRL